MILPIIHKRIAKLIDSDNYDAVLVNHDYLTKSPYILRYLTTRTIYILHEPQREFYEPSKFHAPFLKDRIANILRLPLKYIDLSNTKHADIILANSKYSREQIKKIYKREPKVLYPGINPSLYKPSARVKVQKYILLVGGFSRLKGHDFVIQSLKKMLEEYTIIIVGTGRDEDRNHLEKIASEKKNNIMFVGYVNENEMIDLYRKATVTCIGAYKEPLGLVSIESQSCGTPVIAINEAGCKETIINGKTGYLAKRSQSDFYNKVLKVIKNREKLSKAARGYVKTKWSWSNTYKTLDKIINTSKS